MDHALHVETPQRIGDSGRQGHPLVGGQSLDDFVSEQAIKGGVGDFRDEGKVSPIAHVTMKRQAVGMERHELHQLGFL